MQTGTIMSVPALRTPYSSSPQSIVAKFSSQNEFQAALQCSIVIAMSAAFRSRRQNLDSTASQIFIHGFYESDVHEVMNNVTMRKFGAWL